MAEEQNKTENLEAQNTSGQNIPAQAENKENLPEKAWYVIHTQTGHEDKIREKIFIQIKMRNFGDRVFDVLVPTEDVVEVKHNKQNLRKRKFFPSYLLVQMIMTSESYWFIRNIPGISGFLGDPRPTPLPEEEIASIITLSKETDGKPRHAVQFERGEQVRVIEGPFKHFIGTIEEVNEDKNKLKVMVTVFDRATPVEVDYLQVEKVN